MPAPASPPFAGAAPASSVRGEKWLAPCDRLAGRVDAWLHHHISPDANPLLQTGAIANVLFAVAVASGIAMLFWYSPSVTKAYDSLATLDGYSLGGWVRTLHRYSSDACMLFVLLHTARVFFARKITEARWLPWVSGVVLLGLLWFIGWTGYWLAWDERGQLVALNTIKAADALPIFAGPRARLFVSDRTVPSLLFFVVFFVHLLLPLSIVAGLAVHLMRLSRSKIFPHRALMWWTIGAVAVVSIFVPATNAAPAQMAVTPDRFTLDWWYLWPLAFAGRFSGGGLWAALFAICVGVGGLPWWLHRRRPRASFQASVTLAQCHGCTQCSQDCPFDAITMVARTDGRKSLLQSQVDPARCVGCGVCSGSCDTHAIELPWIDSRAELQRLEAFVVEAVAGGRSPLIALVADHGASLGRDLLVGYHVVAVPSVSWVQPKLIERVIAKGAAGVVVLDCADGELPGRDASRWFLDRLAGTRKPAFNTYRADPTKVVYLTHDAAQPELTRAAAAAFASTNAKPVATVRPLWRALALSVGLSAVLAALTLAGSHAPFRNPAPAAPELVLSFTLWGDWVDSSKIDAKREAAKPIHMRNVNAGRRTRSAVRLVLSVDGVVSENVVQPLGLSHDGACIAEIRRPLPPGQHDVSVAIFTSPDALTPKVTWKGTPDFRARRATVLSYDPNDGFRLEP